jgi:hypothetical protein
MSIDRITGVCQMLTWCRHVIPVLHAGVRWDEVTDIAAQRDDAKRCPQCFPGDVSGSMVRDVQPLLAQQCHHARRYRGVRLRARRGDLHLEATLCCQVLTIRCREDTFGGMVRTHKHKSATHGPLSSDRAGLSPAALSLRSVFETNGAGHVYSCGTTSLLAVIDGPWMAQLSLEVPTFSAFKRDLIRSIPRPRGRGGRDLPIRREDADLMCITMHHEHAQGNGVALQRGHEPRGPGIAINVPLLRGSCIRLPRTFLDVALGKRDRVDLRWHEQLAAPWPAPPCPGHRLSASHDGPEQEAGNASRGHEQGFLESVPPEQSKTDQAHGGGRDVKDRPLS